MNENDKIKYNLNNNSISSFQEETNQSPLKNLYKNNDSTLIK